MKTIYSLTVLCFVVTLTGCMDAHVTLQFPESAFDGQGIDVIGFDDGMVTKDMVTGDIYESRSSMEIVLMDDPEHDGRWFASMRGPKPGSAEYLAAQEAAAAAKAAKEAAEASRLAERQLIEETLGPDNRWFPFMRGPRTLPVSDSEASE